jgi:ABC-2 type transport system permease protein
VLNLSRRALLIARRDYLISVRSKSFLFGLIVFPVLFGGSLLGVAILKAKPDLRDRHVALIDRTGRLADFVVQAAAAKSAKETFEKKTGVQISPRYIVEPVAPEPGDPNLQRLALSGRVRSGELFAFIDIGASQNAASQNTVGGSENAQDDPANAAIACYTNAGAIDKMQAWLSGAVNDAIKTERLTEAGIDRSRVPAMLAAAPVDNLDLLTMDAKTGAIHEPVKRDELAVFIVPFAAMMLLMMIVMMGCAPMMAAVTEDKSQRIVEMLLGVATPHDLMMGKVLAGVARSLTSSVLYVTVGTVALIALQVSGAAPLSLLPWFYVYLVAEVTMLCALSVGLGAACNSPQEAQNLMLLVLAPVMVPVFLMLPVLDRPNGPLAIALSLFPPFTPMLMVLRQAMPGGVPLWQLWMGLLGVLACSLVGVWAASRVFRVAILMQGQPPRLADIVRWAVKG